MWLRPQVDPIIIKGHACVEQGPNADGDTELYMAPVMRGLGSYQLIRMPWRDSEAQAGDGDGWPSVRRGRAAQLRHSQ